MDTTRITSGRKPYQELTFTDDYMFCKILEHDLELARQLVAVILDKDILKVELVDVQHTVSINSDIKSVRFDVYLNDEAGTVFDLEMQALRKPEIPRRSRYYQSITDIDHLAAGMKYEALPDVYVIFICTFDPFYQGLPRYEFRNLCVEHTDLELGDGTSKVFVNAKSESRDISPDLRALLDYIGGKDPSSDLTRYISESIARAKRDRRWERDYVTFEEKLREEREAGREEGREEGMVEGRANYRDAISKIIVDMIRDGRSDELVTAAMEGAALDKLIEDYDENAG